MRSLLKRLLQENVSVVRRELRKNLEARGTSPAVVRRMDQECGRLAYRHRAKVDANAQPLYTFLLYLADYAADEMPETCVIKFAFRLLLKYDGLEQAGRILAQLRGPEPFDLPTLKRLSRTLRDVESRESAGTVSGADIRLELQDMLNFLSQGRNRMTLRFNESDDPFAAYMDGRQITLPKAIPAITSERISLSDEMKRNWPRYQYLFLLAHEYFHAAINSFGFSFHSTPEILERLKPRAETYRTNRSLDHNEAILRRLRSEMADREIKPFLSHLEAFTLFFPDPKFAAFWVNLFEDIRNAKALKRWWPRLAEIGDITNRLVVSKQPHPVLCSPAKNLIQAAIYLSYGLDSDAFVAPRFKPLYERLKGRIREYQAKPLEQLEVASSVEAALDVLEILEQDLPAELHSRVVAVAVELVPLDLAEIAYRRHVADLEFRGDGPPAERVSPRPEREILAGQVYDEYNVWNDARERAVVVNESRFMPDGRTFAYQEFDSAASTPAFVFKPIERGLRLNSRRLRRDGEEMAEERFSEVLASAKAGFAVQDIYWGRKRTSSEGLVSILIDLSVSMEAERRGLANQRPISLALQATAYLSEALTNARIDFGIFGGIDGGRRSLQLKTVKDYAEPYSTHLIRGVHAVAFGGCRIGGFLRHLDQRIQNPDIRHLVLVLTDCGSRYLQLGWDDLIENQLHRTHCPECMARVRRRCTIEPLAPSQQLLSGGARGMYFSSRYEMADIADACRNISAEALLGFIGDQPPVDSLDEFLPGKWLQITSEADVGELVARVSKKIAGH